MEELKTLKEQVETILRDCPDSRNSDKMLTWKLWERYYGVMDSISICDLMKLPSQSNIQRIRAVFQNKHQIYLPTDENIAKQRRINMELWRECMSVAL